MSTGLTDDDLDRIRAFLETPAYARTPEQLLPTDGDGADEHGDADPVERPDGRHGGRPPGE